MNLITDLTSGWMLTLRKVSVQINAVNAAWVSLIWAAPDLFPAYISLPITLLLTVLSMLASNTTQASVASYDPTKYRLVALDTPDGK